ncbi:MAG: septal ring lytic transglycosylase RlpA family protein [Actinomycetia bacterium]|nr:septal ring lytic transglycosylase RlpA family protein [Actinomycetes bacterium]
MPRRYITKQEKFTGLASWYGPGFHGKRTASGEIFNQNDFTCAHKILPLGSYVLVTYKGRSIVLKVNDRGPFIPGRVLDLSKAAAYYLGFTGVVEVEAEIVEPVL